ncbi:MAG: hypothetical protein R6X19_01370 [Kiritimatiellia bacterium]
MNNRIIIASLLTGMLVARPASAQTGSPATATPAPPQGCRAILQVQGKELDLFLVRKTGDQLYFRMPQAPANALSAIKVESVQAAEFPIEPDDFAIFEATRTRQWRQAAELILKTIGPCMSFLDLPKNNAAQPALDAGFYLMRAAGAARGKDGAMTVAASNFYEQASQVYRQIAAAEWFNGREQARLRAALCQTACGKLDQAAKWLQEARIPDPGDGDYGLYQLAEANLLFAQGKTLDACNAAARSAAFENKDPQVFPDGLLLSARCHEELKDYYRARDIYFEVARLFGSTEWSEQAFARLTIIMDNRLTAEKENAIIAKVFFGSEEDMQKVIEDFVAKRRDQTDKTK